MARTNIPVTALSANSGVVNPGTTAIDQANGMNVQPSSSAIPPAGDALTGLVLLVANSAAGAHVVTVRAGVNPPSMRAAKGDLTVSIPASQSAYIGPFESGRFEQADGSINVDFDAGTTGTVLALRAPRTV